MQVKEEVDLRATARTASCVVASLLVGGCETLLLFKLWSARNSPPGAPASLYYLPILALLPWVGAMQWLWKVRNDARSGALDAAGASRCYSMIQDMLSTACVAIVFILTMK